MKPRSIGRLLRTVRQLRPKQLFAQLAYTVSGPVLPIPCDASGLRPTASSDGVAFLPAPAHARLRDGSRLELIGREVAFEKPIAWEIAEEGPLWAFHLHQFDYLRDPDLSADLRWRWMRDWIEHCRAGAGWSPHPISLRLLSWGKLFLTPGALALESEDELRFHDSMASQAETLSQNLEVRLQANHLFSNLLGVVFAGLFYEGVRADTWLAHEATLRAELEEQILADGSHVERSPMYHGLLLESLLDLLNLAKRVPARMPAALLRDVESCASRMLAVHRTWLHPDGEIALLGDSAFDIAQPPQRLDRYAAALGVEACFAEPKGFLADAGVARLRSGAFCVIASAAAPSPHYQPGHAHCDALSFELSIGEQRVVSDTGVSQYIPGPQRDESRATSSHATLRIDGSEQSETWSAHRVGGRARVRIDAFESARAFAARCASWSSLSITHSRRFVLHADAFEIEDRIEGRRCRVEFFLPLAPEIEPQLRSDPDELWLELLDGRWLRVELPAGVRWWIETTHYFPRFGSSLERASLCGEAWDFDRGHWRFTLAERAPWSGNAEQH